MLPCGGVLVCSESCRRDRIRKINIRSGRKSVAKRKEVDKGAGRTAVMKRDGNYCLLCGAASPLELHRVRYGSEGGKYEVSNTVLLCTTHHNAPVKADPSVHSNKKLWQPLLLDHLAGTPGATAVLRAHLRVERSRLTQ
jgi:hypothetical protein